MYCNANQYPGVSLCVPYSKPHGAREKTKPYHLRFDTKLSNGVCTILRIPCAYVSCTSMIDKPWISGTPSNKK